MAISDAYATAAEYRGRVTKTDTADDATILTQLTAVSRYLENRTGQFFNQDAALVQRYYPRVVNAGGGSRLKVDPIATATGLVVKWDDAGTFAYGTTLAITTDFFLAPYNAAREPEALPWTYLELNPKSAVLGSWPTSARSIEVTAKFGWPAVPAAIKELTIAITREVRDLQESGATAALQSIDAVISESRELTFLMRNIENTYRTFGGF